MSTPSALQRAPQLSQFLLSNVVESKRLLGSGSYAIVKELIIDGLPCAGKVIQDSRGRDREQRVDKFHDQCSLLSELRHPHIVQFLGICFLHDSELPVLVMECLHCNLEVLLLRHGTDFPLSTSLSILHGVASGLVYLHNRSPAVIHCNLNAQNVLLNSAMVPKIAGFGSSKILHLGTETTHPGTKTTYPMTEAACLGTKTTHPTTATTRPRTEQESQSHVPFDAFPLDIYSFGVLSQLIANPQDDDQLYMSVAYMQIARHDVGHTELNPRRVCMKERTKRHAVGRRRHMEERMRPDQKLGESHPLVMFIRECLADDPAMRPTARQAMETLRVMSAEKWDPHQHMDRYRNTLSLNPWPAWPCIN